MPATSYPHAASAAGTPIPRSVVAIGLAPDLRGRLAALAGGRTLAIGFYATRCCTSVAIGDLTASWVTGGAPRGAVALAPIEGVSLVADARLVDLLRSAGPTIRLVGPVFARHPAVMLERPELWIDFLGTPEALRRR